MTKPKPPVRTRRERPRARTGTVGLLPSGRRLSLDAFGGDERLEILSPTGVVELSIVLTPAGPVLRLNGAQLEIRAADTVSIECRRLELKARDELSIQAGGDLGIRSAADIRVKSAGQTFVDADYVNLNCLDRNGYHDGPGSAMPEPKSGAESK